MLLAISSGMALAISMWILMRKKDVIAQFKIWQLLAVMITVVLLSVIVCSFIGEQSYFLIALVTIISSSALIINYQSKQV